MPARRLARVVSVCALLSLVLVKFQNCAPTHPSQQFVDAEVRLIDQWNEGKIEFMNSSYLVETTARNISVPGLCVGAPKGQVLVWQLLDDEQVVKAGYAECVMGGFQLTITGLEFSGCDRQLELRAHKRDSEEPPAVTVLRPFCDT